MYQEYKENEVTTVITWRGNANPSEEALHQLQMWRDTPRTFSKKAFAILRYTNPGQQSILCTFLAACRGIPDIQLVVDHPLVHEVFTDKEVQSALALLNSKQFYLGFTDRVPYAFPAEYLEWLRGVRTLDVLRLDLPLVGVGNLSSYISEMKQLQKLTVNPYVPTSLKGMALRREEDRIVALYANRPPGCKVWFHLVMNQNTTRLYAKFLRVLYDERNCKDIDVCSYHLVDESQYPKLQVGGSRHHLKDEEDFEHQIYTYGYYQAMTYSLKGGQLAPAVMLRVEDFLI